MSKAQTRDSLRDFTPFAWSKRSARGSRERGLASRLATRLRRIYRYVNANINNALVSLTTLDLTPFLPFILNYLYRKTSLLSSRNE